MKFTVKQFAEANQLQRDDIYPLVQFLKRVGLVKGAGSAPRTQVSKGRTEAVFEADDKQVQAYLGALKEPNQG